MIGALGGKTSVEIKMTQVNNMSNNKKLVLGLLVLSVIWVLLLSFKWDSIERDIAMRVTTALSDHDYRLLQVNTLNRGRDVVLTGVVREQQLLDTAQKLAASVYGVRTVDISQVEFRPFRAANLALKVSAGIVTLSGSLQDAASVEFVRALAAEAFALPVQNDIAVDADVEQPRWIQTIGPSFSALRDVEMLSFDVAESALALSGKVRTENAFQSAVDNVSTLEGITEVNVAQLELAPFLPSWFALKKSEAGDFSLTGIFGNAENARVARTFANALLSPNATIKIEDQLEVNQDYQSGEWVINLPVLLAPVQAIESPEIGYDSGAFTLSGLMREPESYDHLASLTDQLQGGHRLDISGVVLKPLTQPWITLELDTDKIRLSGALQSQQEMDALRKSLTDISVQRGVKFEIAAESSEETAEASWGADFLKAISSHELLDQGKISIIDNNLFAKGVVRTEENFLALTNNLREIKGVKGFDLKGIELKQYLSPTLSIVSQDDHVVVSGLLRDSENTKQLSDVIKLQFDIDIDDHININAEVAEASWLEGVARIIPGLSVLEQGAIDVSGDEVKISGTARSRNAYSKVNELVGDSGETVINEVLLRPWQEPTLDITVNGTRLETVGMMPNQAILLKVEKYAKELGDKMVLPLDTVMAVGRDIHQTDWLEGLITVLPELSALDQPKIHAADGVISVGGVANTEVKRSAIIDMIKAVASDMKVNNLISLQSEIINPQPATTRSVASEVDLALLAEIYPDVNQEEMAACEQQMDERMLGHKVEFEFGSSDLSSNSFSLLNSVLGAIKSCPAVIIEISGHTDDVGDDASNQLLSEKRAQSVADYFTQAGVAKEKIHPIGFGSTLPVGDNRTETGRAANRRIEFNIKSTR